MSYIRQRTCHSVLCIKIPPFAIDRPPRFPRRAGRTPRHEPDRPQQAVRHDLPVFRARDAPIARRLGQNARRLRGRPAGRGQRGLLLLTDDGALQARIAEPRHKLVKRYWAQVEGAPGPADLKALARGVDLGDYVTRPCRAEFIEPPDTQAAQSADPLPRRDPDDMDRACDHRGQEPAGAPDDGGRRLPDVAPCASASAH